jgi:hypothetical protein
MQINNPSAEELQMHSACFILMPHDKDRADDAVSSDDQRPNLVGPRKLFADFRRKELADTDGA